MQPGAPGTEGEGLSPDTSADELADLAADRPDLWAHILAHPNAYPQLQEWISGRMQQESTPEAAADPVAMAAPFVAAPAALKKRKKSTLVVGIVAAAALVIAGTGMALALNGAFDPLFGGSAASDESAGGVKGEPAASENLAPDFSHGVEAKWALTGEDIGSEVRLNGYLPRMMPLVNEAVSFAQPIEFAAGTLIGWSDGEDEARHLVSYGLIDPATGKLHWQENDTTGMPYGCAERKKEKDLICLRSSGGDKYEVVTVSKNGMKALFGVEGNNLKTLYVVDGKIEIAGAETAMQFTVEGELLHTEHPSGESAAAVSNADPGIECAWLYGAGTVSYAGPQCDVDAKEIITEATAFNWSLVAFEDTAVWIVDTGREVTAIEAKTRKQLWRIEGTLPGWYQPPMRVGGAAGSGILLKTLDGYAVTDILSGAQTSIDSDADSQLIAVVGDQVLTFPGERGRPLSEIEVFSGTTGNKVYSGSFPAIKDVAQVIGGPNGVRADHYFCADCSTAGGSHSLDHYTFLGPVGGNGTVAASQDGPPAAIPSCPTDTILLAWAELKGGWILVCGVSIDKPSYVAVKLSADSKIQYSDASSKPSSKTATDAVIWDSNLRRYTVNMADSKRVVLDYDIGTVTVRDASGRKTEDQSRFVRYVFVPISDAERKMSDASAEDGAFGVKAPTESAKERVRYMVEVLEKAYEGRAMLKGALPKLELCTAKVGGYDDSVKAMEAVRDNRAELLEALDAMPVDQIPEGQQLLDDLSEAIRVSHEANVEYVAWAQAANEYGCGGLSKKGQDAAAASDAPKKRFADRWNKAVAPKFGVRKFDDWFI